MYTYLIYPNIEKRIICDREYFKEIFSFEFISELCALEACINNALKDHLTSIPIYADNFPEEIKVFGWKYLNFLMVMGFGIRITMMDISHECVLSRNFNFDLNFRGGNI